MDELAQETRARALREAALSEVLSSYVEPRAVSYRFVAGFVVAGLLGCISVAWTASQLPSHAPARFEAAAPESLEKGIAAFNRGDWDEAERLLRKTAPHSPQVAARLEDYGERIALIRRDGERLARAEEALDGGDPEQALALAGTVGANSPLYAQAEVLSRAARAQAEAASLAQQAARLEHAASRSAVARTYGPAPELPPVRPAGRRHSDHSAHAGGVSADEAW